MKFVNQGKSLQYLYPLGNVRIARLGSWSYSDPIRPRYRHTGYRADRRAQKDRHRHTHGFSDQSS